MKKISKILALLLSLLLVLSFASCSSDDENGTETEIETKPSYEKENLSDEEQIIALTDGFFNDFKDRNVDNLGSYCVNGDKITEAFENLDFDSAFGSGEELTVSEETTEKLIDKIFYSLDYKVENVSIDGENATADVTLLFPDFENVDSMLNDDEVFQKYLKDRGKTFQEFAAEAEGLSAEELEQWEKDAMSDFIEWALDEIISSGETKEGKFVFSYEMQDGKWLISDLN